MFYTVFNILYYIFLHPLRRFPGPLLSKITIFNSFYYKGRGETVDWLDSLHKKYGPIVRVGPNQLSFIQPEAWKDIYGHRTGVNAGKPNFQKELVFYGRDQFAQPGDDACGIIRTDDINHARQRRLMANAFSDKSMKEQEPLLRKYVDILVSKLETASANPETKGKVNIVDWYNFTTFDIMADLTFGEPLHLLNNSSYSTWVRSVFGFFKFVSLQQITRAIPGLEALLSKFMPKSVQEKKQRHLKFASDRVDKRLAMKTERPDIWTYVLRYSNSPENKDRGLTINEMYSNSSTFMIAGTETTATLLSGLTYLLLKHPDDMRRLVKEIRDTFPTREDIKLQKLAPMEYLNACVEEALRIYPPAPIGFPRITPAQGATVCDEEIPGGTVVSVSNYSAYHSPLNFKRPDEFLPQRWLPEGKEEFTEDKKQVLQPFSFGPRNCLGKK